MAWYLKDPLPRCGEILPPIINVTPTCSEAFHNNNTYNWTTFWRFSKRFAINLTYYYSNAITYLNALLLRGIVRTRHYESFFLPSPKSPLHHASRYIITIYSTAPARGNNFSYTPILMNVGRVAENFQGSLPLLQIRSHLLRIRYVSTVLDIYFFFLLNRIYLFPDPSFTLFIRISCIIICNALLHFYYVLTISLVSTTSIIYALGKKSFDLKSTLSHLKKLKKAITWK